MPWTKLNYPNAMKNLPGEVRNKAIEIANALLSEKTMEEGIVIATAISSAKEWAANRISDVKKIGQERFVIPYANMWGIKVGTEKGIEKLFSTKKEAVQEARKEAKSANASLTIQSKSGKVEKRISRTIGQGTVEVTKVKKKRSIEFN
jgi:uncharacterized protein YdaT